MTTCLFLYLLAKTYGCDMKQGHSVSCYWCVYTAMEKLNIFRSFFPDLQFIAMWWCTGEFDDISSELLSLSFRAFLHKISSKVPCCQTRLDSFHTDHWLLFNHNKCKQLLFWQSVIFWAYRLRLPCTFFRRRNYLKCEEMFSTWRKQGLNVNRTLINQTYQSR